MRKIKTAILISGRGSNMKTLIEAAQEDDFPAQIQLVISNKKDAPGLEIAKKHGILTKIIEHRDYNNREDFDEQLNIEIESNDCEIICLAGFMRLLTSKFTQKWQNRAINIHPSLLPDFKGSTAVKDAFEAGVKKSGCTVHYLVEEMDAGQIIKQAEVEIFEDDRLEDVEERILQKEHEIYPQALKILCTKLLKS